MQSRFSNRVSSSFLLIGTCLAPVAVFLLLGFEVFLGADVDVGPLPCALASAGFSMLWYM